STECPPKRSKMGQQLFGSARPDARHRPNNGFLKAFDVLRPWLTNDKGRWPMAAFVATSLTESDQELCGLFCIMRAKTVHVEIQDGRNQRTPKKTRVSSSLELIFQVTLDD